MFRSSRVVWPLVSRSTKSLGKTFVSQKSSVYRIQPIPILRSFTTLGNLTDIPSTTQPAPTHEDEWNTYSDRISKSKEIPVEEQTFIDIASHTQADNTLSGPEKVQRLQHILRDIHQHLEGQPELKNAFQRACNMLMYVYIDQGNVKSAKLVFEGLASSECKINLVSIRTMIHGFQKHGTKTDLHKFIQSLEARELFPRKSSLYVALIYAFKHFNDIRGCQFYFAEMSKHGLPMDELSIKVMMEVYRKAKKPESVLDLYNTMKEKNMEITARIYSIVLSALSHDKNFHSEMVKIFDEFKSTNIKMTPEIYISMKWDPLKALQDMKDKNMTPEIRDYNEFLHYYVRKNKFKQALEMYKLMKEDKNVEMDAYSYGIVMDVLVKDLEQSPESVFDLYREMKQHCVKPDPAVYTSLLSACNRAQDLERAMALLEEMESFNVKPNAYTFNSILSILSTMDKTSSIDLDRASLIWEKMTSLGIHPDTRTYNTYLSIISKLVKPIEEDSEEHVVDSTLWGEEESEQHVPRTVREMLRMYRYMRRNHHHTIQPDFATYTIVINSLSAAGQLRSALQVYSDAKMSRVTLPVTAYNELMRALQRGGKISEAMNIWYDMKIIGVLPDTTTYEIVLEACEQLDLVDTLTSIRNQRKQDFARLLELDTKKENRMKKRYQ
ncbi:uncharacterized protein EV154DRAFT_212010 [Mucor mucedo]|uniref:uncharacterized protein n=1 Tax=Mucor mucedo TaxID=29922 RepID=UPI0022202148|nr:uncharacterized protein EV154DRAFT_212010 [Mucor mucedo]KAI7896608.1 hypothetical protein EV154DRAFT_212010 [Mucor mucedo]